MAGFDFNNLMKPNSWEVSVNPYDFTSYNLINPTSSYGNNINQFLNNQLGTETDYSWLKSLTDENGIISTYNLKTLGAALGTLESFYNMYNSNRAYGLAKDQFNFQKQFATKNLANQIASYNTALTDRMQARAAMETGNKNAYDDQINQRKLV